MTKHNEVQNVPSDSIDRRKALQEAERNAATTTYFGARPDFESPGTRMIFEAGFDRGFGRATRATLPLTVSLSPDPRGVHVAVHQGSEFVQSEAMEVPGVVGQNYASGLEAAAAWVDQRRAAFDDENGHADPDTGAFEYGSGAHAEVKLEYSSQLGEIAEGIRSLAGACLVPPPGWECSRKAGHDGPCAASPTPPAGEGQEPVAWLTAGKNGTVEWSLSSKRAELTQINGFDPVLNQVPLYARPAPQAAQVDKSTHLQRWRDVINDPAIMSSTDAKPAQDEREAFENAVINRMKEGGFLEIEVRTECLVRSGDDYQDDLINYGWWAWQARATLSTPPVQEAEKRLRKLVDTYFNNNCGENVYNQMAEARSAIAAMGKGGEQS